MGVPGAVPASGGTVQRRCSKKMFKEENSVEFSPAVNNTVVNTPAVYIGVNSTPAVATRVDAGRGGCKPAAARSVSLTSGELWSISDIREEKGLS